MTVTQIRTSAAPAPAGAYSQALVVASEWIFVAGQAAIDPATGTVVGDDIEAQTRQTLTNIRAILEAAGASLGDVVKVSAFLRTMADFGRFNATYAEFFPAPMPVRTTVPSELSGFLVEMDVIAHVRR